MGASVRAKFVLIFLLAYLLSRSGRMSNGNLRDLDYGLAILRKGERRLLPST